MPDSVLMAQATAAALRARAAWPGVELPVAEFARFLEERLASQKDVSIERLHLADLFLVCAVLRGAEGALEALEDLFVPTVMSAGKRLGLPPAELDEVLQILRERLLVPSSPASRLAQYAGQGPLRGWLLVAAVREARALLRQRRRFVGLDESQLIEDVLDRSLADPELAHIRSECRAAFREAFRAALLSLAPAERTLLRYQVLDGLSVKEMARIYRVHRVTVSRWLIEVRALVEKRTRTALSQRLAVPADELESQLRALLSSFELSLERWLQRDPPP